MKYLNLGCGHHFHPAWKNLDFVLAGEGIIAHNLKQGIPFPDNFFDVVYHSHLLEHFSKGEADFFLKECYRVLRPEGILRAVVPDLESIVRAYLYTLEHIEDGISKSDISEMIENYNWMMLELYDQVTRSESGGDMIRYLRKPNLTNKSFIKSRIGSEAEQHWNSPLETQKKPELTSVWNAIKTKLSPDPVQRLKLRLTKLLINFILGKQACQVFKEGLFRDSGEIHRWMYDRFSLRHLLEQAGFVEVTVCNADQSRIPNFASYSLDVVEGMVRKPDSLFMEAIKP